MQVGVPVTLPDAPTGFAPGHWASYVAAAVSEINPCFNGWFPYDLIDVQGLVGLDAFDTLPPVGRRALTLLLFRSIHRWQQGWQSSRFRKVRGVWHEQPIGSFLMHTLRTLPWIWCEQDGTARSAAPSERWFIRATTESSQRRQFDHLRSLPPDLTRELVHLGATALSALAALGMPVLDLDGATNDPRLLVDLADALAQDRVPHASRNVFLGQVRDAWRVFFPSEHSSLPTAIVVQRAGRMLDVHRLSVASALPA